MHLLFIINPAAGAGRGLARWQAFHSQLKNNTLSVDHVITTQPREAVHLARNASNQYDVLVAAGGDGTVSEVTEGILTAPSRRGCLGILPLGTANDLAQVLGIQSSAQILSSFTSGHTKMIDVLQVQCQVNANPSVRYALLFAGVGIISHAIKKTTPLLKQFLGQRVAYPAGLLRALASYRSPQMNISCDGRPFQGRFLFVGASNIPIAGGGLKLAPGATLDDGLLNINLIEATGPFQALMILRHLCSGRHIELSKVHYQTARSFDVQASCALEVAVDGDLIGHTPVQVRIQPSAIRVAIP